MENSEESFQLPKWTWKRCCMKDKLMGKDVGPLTLHFRFWAQSSQAMPNLLQEFLGIDIS
jgi:hypothetical protein